MLCSGLLGARNLLGGNVLFKVRIGKMKAQKDPTGFAEFFSTAVGASEGSRTANGLY